MPLEAGGYDKFHRRSSLRVRADRSAGPGEARYHASVFGAGLRSMPRAHHVLAFAMLLPICAAACSRDGRALWSTASSTRTGPLVAARTTMVTAWEVPRNPLTDATLDDSRLSNEIRSGFRIFTTTGEASRFTPSKVSCNNCHLNGGQQERSLPLVGVAAMFPEYNRRSGRLSRSATHRRLLPAERMRPG